MNYRRRNLTRPECDARCARFEELFPDLSQTSGTRSKERNESRAIQGNPNSKHLRWEDRKGNDLGDVLPHIEMLRSEKSSVGGIARDYVSHLVKFTERPVWKGEDPVPSDVVTGQRLIDERVHAAKTLGLWCRFHKRHFHTQGESPIGWDFGGDGW